MDVQAGGAGGRLQPLGSGKDIICWAIARFFRQKSAAKMKKKTYFLVFIKRKNGIHSVQQDEMPEICLLLIIIRWGGAVKAIECSSIVCYVLAYASIDRVVILSRWRPWVAVYGCSVVVSALASINVVNRHWARLVLGWVTACGRVNHLGM